MRGLSCSTLTYTPLLFHVTACVFPFESAFDMHIMQTAASCRAHRRAGMRDAHRLSLPLAVVSALDSPISLARASASTARRCINCRDHRKGNVSVAGHSCAHAGSLHSARAHHATARLGVRTFMDVILLES